jgi:hydrogenase maturation protein HypF
LSKRLKIIIHGAVQGVGFRPFIYRLANELNLKGTVLNSTKGVFIEAEGTDKELEIFYNRIQSDKPSISFIQNIERSYLDTIGYKDFTIIHSDDVGSKTALILPDIATCKDCQNEIFDKDNRRYLYPFTNCTNCGPRFSIIEKLPYDRINTSMKIFEMCDDCKTEYDDPSNRRFHAQPNACSVCGPKLELLDNEGIFLSDKHGALLQACEEIKKGKIIAVKGLGGFHLLADARNIEAVAKLRSRKNREEKPLALMFPSLMQVEDECTLSELEKSLLTSTQSPIVLVKKRINTQSSINNNIAPDNPYLGVMLPYTPLHHILMNEIGTPVVATSGNFSEEPICIDNKEALERLKNIADFFLIHNRPIVRHVDDSIVIIMNNREMVIRRARGYAPLPIKINYKIPNLIAVGGHLKNSVALSVDDNVFISQHIGDLETLESFNAFKSVISDLSDMYDIKAENYVCDLHPDYISTHYARQKVQNPVSIQHHYAHIISCMVENELDEEVFGISWDGTGYGTDGTIWGGEFLKVYSDGFQRLGHLRTFNLPGGDKAIKEPWRCSLSLLFELYGDKTVDNFNFENFHQLTHDELKIVMKMLTNKVNIIQTSSAGRLFDAVSSLLNLRQYVRFEGQAAMMLEFLADEIMTNESYSFRLIEPEDKISEVKFIVDWEPCIRQIVNDIKRPNYNSKLISTKFHNTLSEMIVEMSKRCGMKKVVLSGGCFQNKYLTEQTIKRLRSNGFIPYWHQRIPPNDGGLALGQIVAASKIIQKEKI